METTPLVSDQPPTADGERRVYRSPELKGRSIPPASIRKVIYVNGMSTTPDTHRNTCWLLSEITESHVLGIYNLTGSTGLPQGAFFTDLLQCLIDKASVVGLVAQKLSAKATGLPASEKRVYMRRCLSLNLATQSLFDQLLLELGTGRPVVIVCHSQGNLITGNALNALSWVQGGPLHFINVFCLASPALYWPGGTSSQFFTNTDDLIPVGSFGLNLFRDKDWSESGANPNAPWVAPDLYMDAHDIRRYLDKPDFVSAIRKVLGPAGTFPPTSQAPPGAPPGGPQRYVIKAGDTLSKIARQFYGNPGFASRIHAANRATLGNNPHLIFPGRELVIP
jgi:hypothetical protein